MTFYSMALGLLELTSPLVFEAKFKKSLQDCLECYMTMFRVYFPRREAFFGIVEKVVGFLHLYLNHAPKDASEFIGKHRKVLALYYKVHSNAPALAEMAKIVKLEDIVGIELDQDDQDQPSDSLIDSNSNDNDTVLISGSSNFIANDHANIQDNVRKLTGNLQTALNETENELVEVLNMIKFCSQSLPGILPHFAQDISCLISHDSKIVRNHAYELFVRMLRFDPNMSSQLIIPFIGCLECNDASVASHALEKLPDVAPLAQEHLATILGTAFNLGLYSNLEVANPIIDTLTLLNSLSGY